MDLIYKTIESVQRHGASSRGDMSREQWARDRAIFVAVSAHNILRTLRDDLDAEAIQHYDELYTACVDLSMCGVPTRTHRYWARFSLEQAMRGDAEEHLRAAEDFWQWTLVRHPFFCS